MSKSSGNLSGKANVTYTYDATHRHAVSSLSNGNSYTYDANGNMTQRVVSGQTFNLAYDAENRLVSVSGAKTASFVYDADGARVASTMDGATTYFVGSHYEKTGTSVTKYYLAGASRVAMRKDGTVSYLLGDHLGSSSVTTDANGAKTASALYKAFGETRYTLGNLGTDYKFTGQREEASLGIYFFNARWMDPSLGRFTQPDTIVPTSTQGTQAWDRYAFVNNNPVRYNDPTGHDACDPEDYACRHSTISQTCTTVVCSALQGDIGAIVDLIVPTHLGWRTQAEVSAGLPIPISPGVSATGGGNVVFNRNSGELSWSLDVTGEVGVGASVSPVAASLTTGPLVGWGSSTTSDVTQGTSAILSGTAAPDLAVAGAASVPLDGYNVADPLNLSNISLHVDPVYGLAPTTFYGGVGGGTAYAGGGVGLAQSVISITVNLFPWNWNW